MDDFYSIGSVGEGGGGGRAKNTVGKRRRRREGERPNGQRKRPEKIIKIHSTSWSPMALSNAELDAFTGTAVTFESLTGNIKVHGANHPTNGANIGTVVLKTNSNHPISYSKHEPTLLNTTFNAKLCYQEKSGVSFVMTCWLILTPPVPHLVKSLSITNFRTQSVLFKLSANIFHWTKLLINSDDVVFEQDVSTTAGILTVNFGSTMTINANVDINWVAS